MYSVEDLRPREAKELAWDEIKAWKVDLAYKFMLFEPIQYSNPAFSLIW